MSRNFRIAAVLLLLTILVFPGCGKNEALEETAETGTEAEVTANEAVKPAEDIAVPETAAPESSDSSEEASEEETTVPETPSPNIGLTALAEVPNYVNVRKEPSTEAEIVGKIFSYCAATILDEVVMEDGNWFLMTSGNVTGYIKSEFFLVGEEAEALKPSVGVLMGTVTEDYLRVRSAPDLTDPDNVFTYYERGTEVYIEELTEDGWAKIESDDSSAGYVYAECLDVERVFKTAVTLEEEAEEIARKQAAIEAAEKAQKEYEEALARQTAEEQAAREAAQKLAEAQQQAQQAVTNLPEETDTVTALRNAVVAYALQFVGNPYVHGGRSLVTGTDCSGFTSLVYANFGYSLSYTPAGQSEQGIAVDLSDLRPGDLLFYSNSVKYLGHVAMYIGNGQIVHAANENYGIVIWSSTYREPLFARRIIY